MQQPSNTEVFDPLDTILQTLMSLPEGADPHPILIERLRALEGIDGAWIGHPDADGSVKPLADSGGAMAAYLAEVEIRCDDTLLGGGPGGRAWRSGRVEIVADTESDPSFALWRDTARHYGWRSVAAIALGGHAGLTEILGLYARTPGFFTATHWQGIIHRLAGVFGLVLERLEAEAGTRALRASHDRLHTLYRALLDEGDVILRAANEHDLLHKACQHLKHSQLFLAVWLVADTGHKVLTVRASAGVDGGRIQALERNLSEAAITRQALHSRRLVRGDPHGAGVPPGLGWQTWAAAPLHRGGQHWGALAVAGAERHLFDEPMCAGLARIARLIGHGLDELDQRMRLSDLAGHDPLTGLPNRRGLEEHLERAIARSNRYRHCLALGYLDLDDFKPVNDTYGHAAGDRLLITLAQRMRATLRREDFLARFGGDEFLVVFGDLTGPEPLVPLLERIERSIRDPIPLAENVEIRIEASAGVVFYPPPNGGENDSTSAGLLLRRADQALYRAKAAKATRARWWTLDGEEIPADEPYSGATEDAPPASVSAYGPEAARTLDRAAPALEIILTRFIEVFYRDLARREHPSRLLAALSPEGITRLKSQQAGHFRHLVTPHLEESAQRTMARRLGRIHSLIGLDSADLIWSYQIYTARLVQELQPHISAALALPVLVKRLGIDSEEQLAGYADIAREREVTLRGIADACHRRDDGRLGLFDTLCQKFSQTAHAALVRPMLAWVHPRAAGGLRLTACCPDECFASLLKDTDLDALAATVLPLAEDKPALAHCLAFDTAPLDTMLQARLSEAGLRSFAAIDLSAVPGGGSLWIFSPFPGGFSGTPQRSFFSRVRSEVVAALSLLPDPGPVTAPERRSWIESLAGQGLVMHYQPVLDVTTARVVKAEALARLKVDGKWISPYRFLPAFDRDNLFDLYAHGLKQTLTNARTWAEAGLGIDMALNLSPSALTDPRYFEITARLLEAHPPPAGRVLYLELLENEEIAAEALPRWIEAFDRWHRLGVLFAEDDVGAGYSSLTRLRHLPFAAIKIDQGLIRGAGNNPEQILALIDGITRLARHLNLIVIAEGVETPGILEAIHRLGVDFAQGYVIARPLLPAVFLARARKGWGPPPDRTTPPRYAFGALAVFLAWEWSSDTLIHLGKRGAIRMLGEYQSTLGGYFDGLAATRSGVGIIRHTLPWEILRQGLKSEAYRRTRTLLITALIERIRQEEAPLTP